MKTDSSDERVFGGKVIVWDWATGQPQQSFSLDAQPRRMSSDGKQLAVNCADGRIVIISLDGDETFAWEATHRLGRPCWWKNNGDVRFADDGKTLLNWGPGQKNGGLAIWNVESRQLRHRVDTDTVRAVDLSSDGRLVATASFGQAARVWSLNSGQPMSNPLAHGDWLHSVRFSHDGNYLITGCGDGYVRIWDWKAGQLVGPPLEHGTEVYDAAFTSDGRFVISIDKVGAIRVWDWEAGMPIAPPVQAGGTALHMTLTPNEQHLIVGGFLDELVIVDLWSLTKIGADLPPEELVRRGELSSGYRIHDNGGAELLTGAQWLERWRAGR